MRLVTLGRGMYSVAFSLGSQLYLTCWTSFRQIILHDEFVTQNLPKGGIGTAGDCEVTSEHLRHHNNPHQSAWKALPFSI